MGVMALETDPVQHAPGRPFTVDDLETMPDDGNRYELIDGMLLVSPTEAFEARRPFPVRIVPVELLGRLAGRKLD